MAPDQLRVQERDRLPRNTPCRYRQDLRRHAPTAVVAGKNEETVTEVRQRVNRRMYDDATAEAPIAPRCCGHAALPREELKLSAQLRVRRVPLRAGRNLPVTRLRPVKQGREKSLQTAEEPAVLGFGFRFC